MKKRTLAREVVLQALYQLEIRGEEILPELDGFLKDQVTDPTLLEFTTSLFQETRQHQTDADHLIRETVQNWEFPRLALIDKNILRLAITELIYRDDIPPAVSINEAVELAKKYGDKSSGAFVNGVLDKIAKKNKVNK